MSPGKRARNAEEYAVANFREYLRIPSVQPDVNYGMIYRRVDVIIVFTYYREKMVCNLKDFCICTACILWRPDKVAFQVVTN
jgi:hypothetical protein